MKLWSRGNRGHARAFTPWVGAFGDCCAVGHPRIPNAKLVELEGVGHVPQSEAFDDYIRALSTLVRQPVASAQVLPCGVGS